MFIAVVTCGSCGGKLEVHADLSEGVPNSVAIECDCGRISNYNLGWEPRVWIEGFDKFLNQPTAQRSPTLREAVAPSMGGEWTCSECEATNLVVDMYCQTCGHLRP